VRYTPTGVAKVSGRYEPPGSRDSTGKNRNSGSTVASMRRKQVIA
jgi:hypothetical protein